MAKIPSVQQRIGQIDVRRGTGSVRRIVGRKLTRIRQRILLRDDYTCRRCGRVDPGSGLEVDHITPLSLGGAESDSNRQTLCIECHKAKTAGEAGSRATHG